MEYRRLGKTELKVSFLGFGGIPVQRVSAEAAAATIRTGLELGVNFIDTARAYTDSEEKIGRALGGVPRDSYILASKTLVRTGEAMQRDIDLSLKYLNTDYIDLYQCHNVRFDKDEEELFAPGGGLEALFAAKKAGKIRHIGITGHQVERLTRLLKTDLFETVQVPYNVNEPAPEKELLPLARQKDLGILCMKPLGGGALPPDLALRFFLDKEVSSFIPGVESPEQMRQNLYTVTNGQALNGEEQKEAEEFCRRLGKSYCRRCDYCQPCPQGIDISGMFIFQAYFRRYDMKDWAWARYAACGIKPEACVECGRCESRCPYELPIRRMLKEVKSDMEGYRKIQ
ncbi:MAG: aldo/keto reductase [Peptococcaceae bacterium]|nr:aldo/keto reductase [Peptococcaceae bacterium]